MRWSYTAGAAKQTTRQAKQRGVEGAETTLGSQRSPGRSSTQAEQSRLGRPAAEPSAQPSEGRLPAAHGRMARPTPQAPAGGHCLGRAAGVGTAQSGRDGEDSTATRWPIRTARWLAPQQGSSV